MDLFMYSGEQHLLSRPDCWTFLSDPNQ